MAGIEGLPMRSWENELVRYVERGEQEAEARAELENYDNTKATVIAVAMREAEKAGFTSIAAQKREAECSAAYQQWCMERFAAARAYHKAKLRRLAAETWFEMVRTEEATRRAEMTFQ